MFESGACLGRWYKELNKKKNRIQYFIPPDTRTMFNKMPLIVLKLPASCQDYCHSYCQRFHRLVKFLLRKHYVITAHSISDVLRSVSLCLQHPECNACHGCPPLCLGNSHAFLKGLFWLTVCSETLQHGGAVSDQEYKVARHIVSMVRK